MVGKYWQSVVAVTLILPCQAWAQDLSSCDKDNVRVVEASTQVAVNDFNGVKQTVAAAAITRSACIGDSVNRFRMELFGAYVDEPTGKAGVVLAGIGVELRPLDSAPELTITPIARIGYEHFANRGDRVILGGALTVENVVWQDTVTRGSGRDVFAIPNTRLLVGGVFEYTDRRTAGGGGSFLITPEAGASFGGNVSIDQMIGRRDLRLRATGGYQVLGGRGPVSGYGYLDLGLRPVNDHHNGYDWNFTIRGSLGDGGYRGILFGISRRFASQRKGGK